jgi:hypothetical protein
MFGAHPTLTRPSLHRRPPPPTGSFIVSCLSMIRPPGTLPRNPFPRYSFISALSRGSHGPAKIGFFQIPGHGVRVQQAPQALATGDLPSEPRLVVLDMETRGRVGYSRQRG